MKKIVLGILLILSLSIIGCKSNSDYYQPVSNSYYNSNSSFNQETYIWENIYFPTNRTSGAQ